MIASFEAKFHGCTSGFNFKPTLMLVLKLSIDARCLVKVHQCYVPEWMHSVVFQLLHMCACLFYKMRIMRPSGSIGLVSHDEAFSSVSDLFSMVGQEHYV
jgi:hypothetical protein